MAMHFRWNPDSPPAGSIDASVLVPVLKTSAELSQHFIRIGSREYRWGEVFDIQGEASEHWHLPGSVNYLNLGAKLQTGFLYVDGHAGDYAGLKMQGGTLVIKGSAGFGLGSGMSGGIIHVQGDAGTQVGGPAPDSFDGMSDGEIYINGTAGPRCGFRLRRGLIAAQQMGEHAGYQMQAGTLVVVKGPLIHPGMDVKRGTLLCLDPETEASWLPYYQPDCVYEPTIVKIILRHVQKAGFPLPPDVIHAHYRQYSGDRLSTGKGEIFQRVRS